VGVGLLAILYLRGWLAGGKWQSVITGYLGNIKLARTLLESDAHT
jgi:hypothetical protein